MSAFSAGEKLQEAVYTALTTDAILMAAVTAIYDEPPEGAVMPYVAMGQTEFMSSDTKTSYGQIITFTIDTWSDDAGQMQAKSIMTNVDDNLHRSTLSVTGFHLVYMALERATVSKQTDATTSIYKGVQRYKALLQKKII